MSTHIHAAASWHIPPPAMMDAGAVGRGIRPCIKHTLKGELSMKFLSLLLAAFVGLHPAAASTGGAGAMAPAQASIVGGGPM